MATDSVSAHVAAQQKKWEEYLAKHAVEKIYRDKNPSKIHDVNRLLKKYKRKEAALYSSIVKKYEEVIQQKEDKYLYRYTSQQNDSGQKSGRFNNVSGRGGRVSGRAGDARERSGRGSALPLTSGGSSSGRARCLTHGPFLAIVLPLLTVIMKR